MKVNDDLISYETNVDAWSDHAAQKKWFYLPKGEKFEYSKRNSWAAPKRTVWVQHFQLEKERGQTSRQVHVETRVLVKTHDGVYGLSYLWDENQSDAKLVSEYGGTREVITKVNGALETQTWKAPSRMECMMCHNNLSRFALGMKTRQLNHSRKLDGVDQNFLLWPHDKKLLNQKPSPQDLKQRLYPIHSQASLANRARSYLDVNCALCHQKGGTTPIAIDLNSHLSFTETKLNRRALLHLGQEKRKIVDPGKPDNSVLLNRMRASGGFTRMPFLGSSEIDHEAAEVIEKWIESMK